MNTADRQIIRRLLRYAPLVTLLFGWVLTFNAPATAAPGINQQLNFQGRLFTDEGATVPDGFYNIQFKIYSGGDGQAADNPDGTLLWSEDHLNDNDQGVTVRNGFLSVSLGAINPFGSSIDWNDDTLWLSMNIAGTGQSCSPFANCSPDGEMIPMKRLTATPYSLNSALLGGVPSSGYVQLSQGLQTDSSSVDSIQLNKTGAGNFLNLQANGDTVFRLDNAGDIVFGDNADHSISIDTSTSGAGRSLTIAAGDAASGSDSDGGDLVLQAGSGDGAGSDGDVRVESLLAVTNLGAVDSDSIICHNSSNQLANCSSTFATETYVTLQNAYDNDNTIQTSSSGGDMTVNLANDSTDPNFIIDIESGSSGRFAVAGNGSDVLGVTSSDVAVNGNLTATGNTVARAEVDGRETFQIQNSNGAALFSVDSGQDANLAANSGAENGAAFSTDWTAFDGSGTATVARNDSDETYIASGSAAVSVNTTDNVNVGVRNNLASSPDTNTAYVVSFSARLESGPAFDDIEVAYSYDGGTSTTSCTTGTYSSREIVTDEWRKISCALTTPGDSVTNPDVIIRQPSAPGGSRSFHIDNLSMVAKNASGTQNTSALKVGGASSQGLTLFTLDTYADTPFNGTNLALAGSMYFDTSQNLLQCYDGEVWSACGGTSDSNVTLKPEYPGTVLNGGGTPGVGMMTTDFCSNDADLNVGSLCSTGESRNFYRWTSPQSTLQTYSLYVNYRLPAAFESFIDSDTIRLTWMTDSANGTDGTVTYQVFRKASGGGVTSCDGSNVSTEASPSADTWYTTTFAGDELSCGFSAGDDVIIKINVSARNNANVYVEDLNFSYTNQ